MNLPGILAQIARPLHRERLVGVYLLLAADEIVYVGQSTDVETRVAWHRWEAVKHFDSAVWFPVAEEDLCAYEGALIRALRPRYCEAAPASHSSDFEILRALGLEHLFVAPIDAKDCGVGVRIAELRRKRRMPQRDLAALLGVHVTAVSHWENGVSKPDIERLLPLAAALGVTTDELLGSKGSS